MGVNADITVHGWLKPTLELQLVAGGALLANTKYYVAGFMCFTPYTYDGYGGPLSDVYDITTDSTNRSIQITHKTYRNITSFADNGDNKTLITCERHCLADAVIGYQADTIKIASGSYAGTWTVDEWVDYDQFIIDTPYVDNVPIQCYTDSQYYNRPKNNFGAYADRLGMTYYVGTLSPETDDKRWKNNWWTRRSYENYNLSNPTTITAQPAKPGDYFYIPPIAAYNRGVFKILDDYGIPTIEILGDVSADNVHDEVQTSGFIYNFGYNSYVGNSDRPSASIMATIRAHGDSSEFSIYYASITAIGSMFHTTDETKMIFGGCSINFVTGFNSAFMFFTANECQIYNNSSGNVYMGWIYGEDNILQLIPRPSSLYGDELDSFFDGLKQSTVNYSKYIEKTFKGNLTSQILQNSYNGNKYIDCDTIPSYWVLSGDNQPPIYMAEDWIIRYAGSNNYCIRVYSYDQYSTNILKFLNVDCPDDADNHKAVIRNRDYFNLNIKWYRRIEFYIQDDDGNMLEGVAVQVVDGDGNTYSDTTDVDGYAYVDVLEQMDECDDTMKYTDPTITTYYTNFVITTSYNGYAQAGLEFAEAYENTRLEIGLVPLKEYVDGLFSATVAEDEISATVAEDEIYGLVVEDL